MYREGKGLRVNWFDLKILLNGSDRCQDQGSEWGMSACVCVCACMHVYTEIWALSETHQY